MKNGSAFILLGRKKKNHNICMETSALGRNPPSVAGQETTLNKLVRLQNSAS